MDYTFITSILLMVFGFGLWIVDLYRRLEEKEKEARETVDLLNKKRFEYGDKIRMLECKIKHLEEVNLKNK